MAENEKSTDEKSTGEKSTDEKSTYEKSTDADAVGAIADDLEQLLTLVPKGKPNSASRQAAMRTVGCSSETRRKLAEAIMGRRPADLLLDPATLNTPIHRLLEAAEGATKLEEVAADLQKLLDDLREQRYLQTYINLPNVSGATPLSLCMSSQTLGPLVSLLAQRGAQLHHLCGDLADRNNHLHFVMWHAAPDTIHRTLDALFAIGSLGGDGMYSLNSFDETPKDVLLRRIQLNDCQQMLLQKLNSVLLRIQGYPPVDDSYFEKSATTD